MKIGRQGRTEESVAVEQKMVPGEADSLIYQMSLDAKK
jgi:hypothetical protein